MILNTLMHRNFMIKDGKPVKRQPPTVRRTGFATLMNLNISPPITLTREKQGALGSNRAAPLARRDSPNIRPAVEHDIRFTDTKSPLVFQKKLLATADEFTGKDARVAEIPVQTSFQPMKTVAEKVSKEETQPEEIQPENLSMEQNGEALSENPERTPEAKPKMNEKLIIALIAAAGIAASYFILKK